MDEYAQAIAKSEIVRALLGEDGGLGNFKTCTLWPSGRADPVENAHVDYDGPQLAFTGELDASLSGLAGYKIAMFYANATNVVFGNAGHIQVHRRRIPVEGLQLLQALCLGAGAAIPRRSATIAGYALR